MVNLLTKKYYTSYFGNYRKLPKDSLCISISRYTPKYFIEGNYPNFIYSEDSFIAPSKSLLHDIKAGLIDHNIYTQRYITDLYHNLQVRFNNRFKTLLDWLVVFDKQVDSKFNSVAFLCYEKPGDFCHRHIFARELKKLNVDIEEFNGNNFEKLF